MQNPKTPKHNSAVPDVSRRSFLKTATGASVALSTGAVMASTTKQDPATHSQSNNEFDAILRLAGSEFGNLKKSG